jgi:hypothetical protein
MSELSNAVQFAIDSAYAKLESLDSDTLSDIEVEELDFDEIPIEDPEFLDIEYTD